MPLIAMPLGAQPPRARHPIVRLAADTTLRGTPEEALARRDTLRALALLLRACERDAAAACDRFATVGWRRLAAPWLRPARTDAGRLQDEQGWRLVEEALARATTIAPDSAHGWLRRAEHHLAFRGGEAHHEAYAHVDAALAAGHRAAGAEGFALAALDAGGLFWRHWLHVDARPDGSLHEWERYALALDAAAPMPSVARYRIAPLVPRPGGHELLQAALLFGLAADSAPDIVLTRRRHYAALGAADRWEELRAAAARRAAHPRCDAVDLLALGLARHRLGEGRGADSAFAAAVPLLPPGERIRLTSAARILPRSERQRLAALPLVEREQVEERFWLLTDPMWRTAANEVRREFLARVAQAELQWGDGSASAGLDSDAGTVLLLNGPPAFVRTRTADGRGPVLGRAWIEWRWATGSTMHFALAPDAREMRLPPAVRARADEMLGQRGAFWANVPELRGIDTIAVQAALFRAAGDSADLFVAARLPTQRLARGMAPAGALELALWIRDVDGALVRRTDARWPLDAAARAAPAVRAWRERLPRGNHLLRVEAWEPVQGVGARGVAPPATLDDARFALHGFGLSQVLVTDGVASRRGTGPTDRWSDYLVVPNPGDLPRDREAALLWELYGDSLTTLRAYRVVVTLERPDARAARSVVEQARDAVIGDAPRRTRSRDRLTVRYARRHPAPAAVRVEQVDLGAFAVEPGRYVLRVDVVDDESGRVATTTRLVTVRGATR